MSNENSFDQPKMLRERKHIPRDEMGYSNKDNTKNKNNSVKSSVILKCEKGMMLIKKNSLSNQFYFNSNPDMPSLSNIEKKIKNNKYDSFQDFTNDLRELWSFNFSYYSKKNPELYQKTLKISNYTEDIINQLQNTKQETNDMKEITKKISTLEKDIKDIKGNQLQIQDNKSLKPAPIIDIPLTTAEKNQLNFNIKKLSTEQLMGIVQIMKDSVDLKGNQSHLEFDINNISAKKQRELEKYVNSCLKQNSKKTKVSESNNQKPKTDMSQKKGPINHTTNNTELETKLSSSSAQQRPVSNIVSQSKMPVNSSVQMEKKIIPNQSIINKPSNTGKAILSDSDSSSSSDSNSNLSSL